MPPNTDFTAQYNAIRYDTIQCMRIPQLIEISHSITVALFSIIITALFECMWKSCFIAAYNKHLSLVLCHVLVVMRAHALIPPNPFSFFIFDVRALLLTYNNVTNAAHDTYRYLFVSSIISVIQLHIKEYRFPSSSFCACVCACDCESV